MPDDTTVRSPHLEGVEDAQYPEGFSVLLTVIVPVYNERPTIGELLSRVVSTDTAKEVIVVDDASDDGTDVLLREWAKKPGVCVLRHSCNRGKGAAIRTGLARARGQFTIIQDADLEYDPCDYALLLQPLLDGAAGAVYGSRRLGGTSTGTQRLNPFYHGVTMLNYLVFLIYGVRLTDEATCYKAFPTHVLRDMRLTCLRFEFCPEVTAKAARMSLRIVEVPISYRRRQFVEGKKIRLRDWFHAVATLWKWRKWEPSVGYMSCATSARASPLQHSEQILHD